MLLCRHQNAAQNHDIEIANRCSENVAQFIYLRTTLTNQNLIREEIKRRLNSGSTCYHSLENIFSSRLLSKNIKIMIYETVIFPVVLYGCETWSLTLCTDGEMMNACRILMEKPEGKRPLGIPRLWLIDNIKMDLSEIGWSYMDWIDLAQDRGQWRALVNMVMNLRVP
ncbi:hypothetical protein B7P43_G09360 [Cryptotermes secundus]|uniref:Endonuclease-reverse transcriptase n=1 Tax=Cryptotermes secundus TaxID=105785 RepID=A0A2J7RNN3_9NEOP|nr:hypothetical protein B7P43_G09360 [Cryptotermes secundus]